MPNLGQVKALRCWENVSAETGRYPKYNIITGGNRCGKTTVVATEVLPALCYGIGAIHPSRQNIGIYHHLLERKRKNGGLNIRLVAPSDSLKEDGAMYKIIKKWIPEAKFSEKDGFYHRLEINGQVIVCKSNGQSPDQHSGTEQDLIIIDEPLSSQLWAENVARVSKGGFIINTITPLKGCDYLIDIADDPEKFRSAEFTKISIWDNCKDIEGVNGHLAREDIEDLIDMWKSHPEELSARVNGDLMKLAGNIFSEFDKHIHIVEELPENDYVYGYAIDPHLVKEPSVIFYAQDASNTIYIYDEYPHREWNMIKSTSKTIEHFCADIKNIVKDKPHAYTIGDPNLMNLKLPNTNKTIASEYRRNKVAVNTKINDSIYIGHGAIHDHLRYNPEEPISADNRPKLFILRKCKNTISAFKKYRWADVDSDKEGSAIEKSPWKCFIDVVRYALVSLKPYDVAKEVSTRAKRIVESKPIVSNDVCVGNANLW
ncbi:MAG: hypothetical protein FWE23_08775 [Chitinivibrionia bacterium]|nr:hypothetical protein [Chitinivibrionia bacterium]